MMMIRRSAFFRYGSYIAVAVLLSILMFPGFVKNLLNTGYFMPHATCYLQDPRIIWLHVSTDSIIGLAYVSIALTLAYLVNKASKDIPFHWVLLAFGLFIVSCGFTHFMEVWTVWQPVYWLSGYVKVITAVASLVTAIALFPLIPKVFRSIAEVKLAEQRRLELIDAHQELAESNRALARQKAELEVANRDLEMFAYSVAHDLRGPSRAIIGMCELLKEDYQRVLPPEGVELLNRILKASGKSQALLTDLLQYSRVSREELDLGTVRADEVLDEALASFSEQMEAQQPVIEADLKSVRVTGSSTLLLEVFINFLGNALKYVKPGEKARIKIWSEPRGEQVRIWVEDQGIGIEPSQHSKIFDLFYRLHGEQHYAGTGIGLAIVKRAAERMGGSAGVESAPGAGSRFWVDLKRAPNS